MAAFEFEGAPMVTEPLEFGPSQTALVTTKRDFFLCAIGGLLIAFVVAVIVALRWSAQLTLVCGVGALIIATIGLLAVTQQLRTKYGGNHWLWEITMECWAFLCRQGLLRADQKGHFAPLGRRVFTAAWVPGIAKVRSGELRDLAVITTSEREYGGTTRHQRPPAIREFEIERQGVGEMEEIADRSSWVAIEPWMLCGDGPAAASMPPPSPLRQVPQAVERSSGPRYRHHHERADANEWYGNVMILVALLALIAVIIVIASLAIQNQALYLHGDVIESRHVHVEW